MFGLFQRPVSARSRKGSEKIGAPGRVAAARGAVRGSGRSAFIIDIPEASGEVCSDHGHDSKQAESSVRPGELQESERQSHGEQCLQMP
jgi:hypothetical protein